MQSSSQATGMSVIIQNVEYNMITNQLYIDSMTILSSIERQVSLISGIIPITPHALCQKCIIFVKS